jgi:bis(5'-nucleosyl)-tetraphosphatase (symmetrical)
MPRTIIIGDIHGCSAELRNLLALVEPVVGDTVVSAGDIMDKGPDAPGAIRQLRDLRDAGINVVFVRGNHEERHERFRKYEASGKPNPMSRVEELVAASRGLTSEDVDFLNSAVLLYQGDGFMVVHGGLLPDHQEVPDLTRPLTGAAKKLWEKVYRVRFVSPEGKMVELGKEDYGDKHWSELYDGRFGTVYYGHEPYIDDTEPVVQGHTVGLDLGCVHGGRLAAAVLSDGKVEFVSVPALRVHHVRKVGSDE